VHVKRHKMWLVRRAFAGPIRRFWRETLTTNMILTSLFDHEKTTLQTAAGLRRSSNWALSCIPSAKFWTWRKLCELRYFCVPVHGSYSMDQCTNVVERPP